MSTDDDHEREFYEVIDQINDEKKREALRRDIYKNGGFVASEVFIDE